MRERWQPGIDAPAVKGRADSGDIEIDLVELLVDAAGLARDVGVGIALFIDEMQDLGSDDVSAICGACHELSQDAAPLIVVGAGLPHLPAVLSASKSYSERLFTYHRIDRLDRAAADLALIAPAAREDVEFTQDALDLLYETADGYPYFVQAYGKTTWDVAADSPITAETCGSRHRLRKRNSPSASSAPATNGRPPPNANTCGPWRIWRATTGLSRPRRSPSNSDGSLPPCHLRATD